MRQAQPDDAMTALKDKRPTAIRVVIPFVFRHWLQQPGRAAIVAGGLLGATAADLFMPIFSGRLVDALTLGASDAAARHAAFVAFGGIVALGSNWSTSQQAVSTLKAAEARRAELISKIDLHLVESRDDGPLRLN